jgi:hypothetical protein
LTIDPSLLQTSLNDYDPAAAGKIVVKLWSVSRTAQSRGYFPSSTIVLEFFHRLRADDTWLAAVGQYVLPTLYEAYQQVLSSFRDPPPSVDGDTTRTSLIITPKVQANIPALLLLSSILDVSVDCCDLDKTFSGKHLLNFIRASCAILLASSYSKDVDGRDGERISVSEEQIACDMLRRNASLSLANITEEVPSCREGATNLIQSRNAKLMCAIRDAPEISIQRSLLRFAKVIYDHAKKADVESKFVTDMEAFLVSLQDGVSPKKADFGASKFALIDFESDDARREVEKFRILLCHVVWEENSAAVRCTLMRSCHIRLGPKAGKQNLGSMSEASIDWNLRGVSMRSESYSNGDPIHVSYSQMTGLRISDARRELEFSVRNGNARYKAVSIHLSCQESRGMFQDVILPHLQDVCGISVKVIPEGVSKNEEDLDHIILPRLGKRKASTPVSMAGPLSHAREEISGFSESVVNSGTFKAGDENVESAFTGLKPDGILLLPRLDSSKNSGKGVDGDETQVAMPWSQNDTRKMRVKSSGAQGICLPASVSRGHDQRIGRDSVAPSNREDTRAFRDEFETKVATVKSPRKQMERIGDGERKMSSIAKENEGQVRSKIVAPPRRKDCEKREDVSCGNTQPSEKNMQKADGSRGKRLSSRCPATEPRADESTASSHRTDGSHSSLRGKENECCSDKYESCDSAEDRRVDLLSNDESGERDASNPLPRSPSSSPSLSFDAAVASGAPSSADYTDKSWTIIDSDGTMNDLTEYEAPHCKQMLFHFEDVPNNSFRQNDGSQDSGTECDNSDEQEEKDEAEVIQKLSIIVRAIIEKRQVRTEALQEEARKTIQRRRKESREEQRRADKASGAKLLALAALHKGRIVKARTKMRASLRQVSDKTFSCNLSAKKLRSSVKKSLTVRKEKLDEYKKELASVGDEVQVKMASSARSAASRKKKTSSKALKSNAFLADLSNLLDKSI